MVFPVLLHFQGVLTGSYLPATTSVANSKANSSNSVETVGPKQSAYVHVPGDDIYPGSKFGAMMNPEYSPPSKPVHKTSVTISPTRCCSPSNVPSELGLPRLA